MNLNRPKHLNDQDIVTAFGARRERRYCSIEVSDCFGSTVSTLLKALALITHPSRITGEANQSIKAISSPLFQASSSLQRIPSYPNFLKLTTQHPILRDRSKHILSIQTPCFSLHPHMTRIQPPLRIKAMLPAMSRIGQKRVRVIAGSWTQ